jgi:hypothetical protein
VVGGEYTISSGNSYQIASACKLVRIRSYPRDQLQVKTVLPLESYRPGDTVSGTIKVDTNDGSPFEVNPTFDYSVSFDTVSEDGSTTDTVLIEESLLELDSSGSGVFSFVIPSNTNSLLQTIAFMVNYGDMSQTHSQVLVITQNDMMVIDFYTETQGPFVRNVTNQVYFQAWATDDRADVLEFQKASLLAEDSNGNVVTLLSKSISTEHRGKGSFKFDYSMDYTRVYLEVQIGQETLTRDLIAAVFPYDVSNSMKPYIYNDNNEVTFTVLNSNKIVLGS